MLRGLAILMLLAGLLPAGETALLHITAQAVRDRFAGVTAADMEMLRGKRIFWASRSFGLNTRNGLARLAQQDKIYDLLAGYERFDAFKVGGDLGIIPPGIFGQKRLVHALVTPTPYTQRLAEVDAALRKPPLGLAQKIDAVVVFYHTANPAAFPAYAATLDGWRRDFPDLRVIYVTAGFMGPKQAEANEAAHAFSDLVRARYAGKVPLFDMGAILSDDFRAGHVYCPEYSKDPADVHPNLPPGEDALAKGFILALRDAFGMKAASLGDLPPLNMPAASPTAEAPYPLAPDYLAVRRLLDANGLKQKQVEGVAVFRNKRVVELYLQEGGMTTLTDDIGQCTELERLHLYGDRKLPHPLLTSVSPAIGRCTKLRDLLLTGNDLTALPVEITRLQALTSLSLGDNRLHGLAPEVRAWLEKFDPQGLARQSPAKP